MLSHDAYGGLEHRASSANLHTPQCLATRKAYEGVVELLSHELFHAWNGKRIAPPALHDFDYSGEAYTRCLWVMEGLTSHYDRWALRTSGAVTTKSFAEKVLDDWTRLLAIPGRRRQSPGGLDPHFGQRSFASDCQIATEQKLVPAIQGVGL